MRRYIWIAVSILLVANVILVSYLTGQPAVSPPIPDAGALLSGEHTPIIFTDQDQIRGAAHPCTTAWMQTGSSSSASDAANRNIDRFDPEVFTLSIKLATWGAGDSAGVQEARFECAYDTTGTTFWNGDSSNVFISDGAFNLPDYGVWRFEPVSNTSLGWLFPVRLLIGGYTRFIFSHELADTCSIDWSLTCEH